MIELNKPNLFLEINNKNFIFLVGRYDDDLNLEILDKTFVQSLGIEDGKTIDIINSSSLIQSTIEGLENKLDFTF